jgi:multisubunit Na+/H+ antiporter MnhF subunit
MTAPGETDWLLVIAAVVLIGAVLGVGVLFFWLHSLPERMIHKTGRVQFEIVAVLGLLSLFTHIHLFWVAALLLALVKFPEVNVPDFTGPLDRIASSLERLTPRDDGAPDVVSTPASAAKPKVHISAPVKGA